MYTAIFPLKDEFNLSMVWCTLVVLFSLYPLKTQKVLELGYKREYSVVVEFQVNSRQVKPHNNKLIYLLILKLLGLKD